MYFQTSQRYKDTIYNPSIQSVVNIYVDGVLLNPKYLTDFKIGCELFNDNFELGSVPSQYVEMQIHKNSGITNPKTIKIEYGILVNNALTVAEVNSMLVKDFNSLMVRSLAKEDNSFEIIPIGIYNVDDYNSEDDNVINIKALDNIIKLDKDDGYYDASALIEQKGYATLGEIAQDICDKKGLELVSSSFLNSNKQITVYDNQLKAREYMSYIAEKAGGFCRANREGKIEFRKIGQDTVKIPLKLFKTYKFGEEYKISRVAYEDGIRSFKFGNETRNTLWIRQENLFVVDKNSIENIYNSIKGLTITGFEGTVIIDPAVDIGDKIQIGDKYIIYQGEMSLNKRFIADIKSKISIKQKEETTVKKESQKVINRRVQSEIDEANGKITQLIGENSETKSKLSEHTQTIDTMKDTLKLQEKKLEKVEGKADANTTNIETNTTKITTIERDVGTITQSVSAVEEKVEGIEVGGRNLLWNSNFEKEFTVGTNANKYGLRKRGSVYTVTRDTTEKYDGTNTLKIVGTSAGNASGEDILYYPLGIADRGQGCFTGKSAILSFYAKSQNSSKINCRLGLNGYKSQNERTLSNVWKKYEILLTSSNYSDNASADGTLIFKFDKADTVYLAKMKLEFGNKATDWTPAPEDVDNNLKDNYYTKTETNTTITQKITDNNPTILLLVNKKIEEMQIGGTQLLRGTNTVTALTSTGTWANGTWRSASGGNGTRQSIEVTDSSNANIKKGWRLTRTSSNNTSNIDIAQDAVAVTNGQTYTLSCYARKISGTPKLRLQYGKNPYPTKAVTLNNTTWAKYSFTFKIGEKSDGSTGGNTNIYLGLDGSTVASLEICGMKLESGNKATDWTPAPEDIQADLRDNYYDKIQFDSKIEQKADSITQEVTKKVENIQVDADNLLLNTALKTDVSNFTLAAGITRVTDKLTPNGNYCFKYNISGLTADAWRSANPDMVALNAGEIVTASANVYVPSGVTNSTIRLEIQYFNASNSRISTTTKTVDLTKTNQWQRIYVTGTAPANTVKANARVWIQRNGQCWAGDLKLGKGNTLTAWCPSSKDYSSKEETKASIKVATDAIDTEVSKKVGKTEVGTYIKQNTEAVKVAWNQISEYIQMMILNGNASLAILDNNKKVMMALDKTGQHFYKSDGTTVFGEMGVQKVDNKNYISFSVEGEYNKSISDGMAWGLKTKSDGKFWPILYIKNFNMPPKGSDRCDGELVLNSCNMILDGIGSGITTGNIKMSGDPVGDTLYFATDDKDLLTIAYNEAYVNRNFCIS